MRATRFPTRITNLPPFGPFEARRLEGSGCDVLFACYPAGSAVDEHRHDTDNVGVVTAGELILTIGGVERHYSVGEWYEMPAGRLHAARFETDTVQIEFWFAPT